MYNPCISRPVCYISPTFIHPSSLCLYTFPIYIIPSSSHSLYTSFIHPSPCSSPYTSAPCTSPYTSVLPLYIAPIPLYITPLPLYIALFYTCFSHYTSHPLYIPLYVVPLPLYIMPLPLYITLVYTSCAPPIIHPALCTSPYTSILPLYIAPLPLYIAPLPLYIAPLPLYIAPFPLYITLVYTSCAPPIIHSALCTSPYTSCPVPYTSRPCFAHPLIYIPSII